MRVAFGCKAHSGWAAHVSVGLAGGEFVVVDRRRIEMVDEAWAKQPYHAAEHLEAAAAKKRVQAGVKAAHTGAIRELKSAIRREAVAGNEVVACGVLLNEPMPEWTVEEILAVHFRMHKAEGVLFREALARAAEVCGLRLVAVHQNNVWDIGAGMLSVASLELDERLKKLGKPMGAPWGKDQKEATLAALIALKTVTSRSQA
jgi:hypothetical protein